MADNTPSEGVPDADLTTDGGAVASAAPRGIQRMDRRDVRRMERAARKAAGTTKVRPLRAVGTAAAVVALLAGVAIPAYAATQPVAETVSMQDAAEAEAQSIAVDAAAQVGALSSTSYAATTPEEIAEAKAAAAAAEAAERAREQAALLAQQQQQQQQQNAQQAPSEQTPLAYDPPVAIDGAVCPLPTGSYYVSRSVGSGHEGADLVTAAMTPIYAVKAGTVTTSQEALGGWGVTVAIDHGDGTTTLYGHMTYGTRQVEVGQTVEAGQIIGYVGSTGHSTANHLHIELRINGAIVDPLSYLPI